jgi:hypothetical protein
MTRGDRKEIVIAMHGTQPQPTLKEPADGCINGAGVVMGKLYLCVLHDGFVFKIKGLFAVRT